MNINLIPPEEKLSRIFRAISTPVRFQILAAIGTGEACVCHLEAVLDMRQAYISQQLMDLRDAELLETRREGRFIFYRLAEPRLLDPLLKIGALLGIPVEEIQSSFNICPLPNCCCPSCDAHRLQEAELEKATRQAR